MVGPVNHITQDHILWYAIKNVWKELKPSEEYQDYVPILYASMFDRCKAVIEKKEDASNIKIVKLIGWMDACPIMETDGDRNQRNLLPRLVIVYSGAIGASDNQALFF